MQFTFAHPQYLFLLFGAPLLFVIHFLSLGNKKKKALKFANFDAIAKIQGIDFFSKNIIMLFLSLLILVLIVFAIAGLTLHTERESSSFSFVLALDSSQSMEAKDISPDRLTSSKETAKNFIDVIPIGVKVGILSFSGSSQLEKELSQEKIELKLAIDNIQLSGFGGTDLYEAIVTSSNLLRDEESKAIILLSDGQINVGNIEAAIDYANRNNVILHSILIGTKEGGETTYFISKADEQSMQSLAYNTGGRYYDAENKTSLSNAFEDILLLKDKKVAIDLTSYLLVFAVVFFILKFFLINTRYIDLP